MRILTILLVLLPFFAFTQINQTDADGLRQGLWKKQQPNGRTLYEGNFKDGRPVGEWKRYHPGGQVKAIIQYHENSDTASVQLFDKFRKKIAEGSYVEQKKAGNWVYYSKGRKIAEEQFRDGLKNGVAKKYYETGELMEETDWVNGKQEGDYKIFYKTGEPYMQCKMRQNKRHGLCLIHSKEGKLELEAHYKNDLRHGEWNYYSGGKFHYRLNYNNGEILNPEVRDSIANLQMQSLEKNKGTFTDPEKFMEDPSGYMRKQGTLK